MMKTEKSLTWYFRKTMSNNECLLQNQKNKFKYKYF